jgi:SAM-dependent methyltransferase
MTWLLLLAIVLILGFGFVVAFGPPYLPTMRKQTDVALDMLALSPGQSLLELGSGDGRVALAAARRGLTVVGIELNPFLVVLSRIITWRYRKRVKIIWGNQWHVAWPQADGIFTFLLQRQMTRLDEHIKTWHTKPVRLASFAFHIPGKEPASKRDGIFLYIYH